MEGKGQSFTPDRDQLLAINAGIDQPLAIAAGPGTGKTQTMTQRFLALARHFAPEEILALTFTNKAAEEMSRRLEKEGLDPQRLWVSTFHALAARLLRESPFNLGLDVNFRILEENQQELLLRQCIRLFVNSRFPELQDLKERFHLNLRSLIAEFPRIIRRIKLHLLTPEEFQKLAEDKARQFRQTDPSHSEEETELELKLIELLAEAYAGYQDELLRQNALDFADLLLQLYHLLQNEEYRQRCRKRFKYILVDEFQDTNPAQFLLLELLAQPGMTNVSVVGDCHQSIYGFRDAEVTNLTERFPRSLEIPLTHNYRSFQSILDLSRQLMLPTIKPAPRRLKAQLGKGGEPTLGIFAASSTEEEAEFIARKIRDLLGQPLHTANKRFHRSAGEPINYGDFAILLRKMRNGEKVRIYQEALARYDIPFQTIGGGGFLHAQEVADVINFLRLVDNPLDSLSLAAVLKSPCFWLFDRELYQLRQAADLHLFAGSPLFLALLETEGWSASLEPETRKKIGNFSRILLRMSEVKHEISLSALVSRVMEESGYLQLVKKGTSLSDRIKLANLQRLYRFAQDFEESGLFTSLSAFLQYIATLVEHNLDEPPTEIPLEEEVVTIMTIHQAKGLEFPVVFLSDFTSDTHKHFRYRPLYFSPEWGLLVNIGPTKKRFHHYRSVEDPRVKEAEEEVRIKYVAMTRAQELLIITTSDALGEEFQRLKDYCQHELGPSSLLEMPEEAGVPTVSAKDDRVSPMTSQEVSQLKERLNALSSLQREGEQGKAQTPPQKEIHRRVRISFSQLNIFRHCPVKYQYLYQLKVPTLEYREEYPLVVEEGREAPGLSPTRFGTLVHKTLFEFHRLYPLKKGVDKLKLMTKIFRQLGVNEGLCTSELNRILKQKGEALFTSYAAHPYSEISPLFLEQEFNLKLPPSPPWEITVNGFIDRVHRQNGEWFLVDYKTTPKLTSTLKEDYRFQMGIYLLACRSGCLGEELRRAEGLRAEVFLLAQGRPEEIDLPEEELPLIEQTIREMVQRIEEGDFRLTDAHSRRDCLRCGYGGEQGFCPHKRV
ncbi:MAG: ATP-dependent helicase [Acidobacteriota bacterium]